MGSCSTLRAVLFDWGAQELPGGLAVSDGCGLVESEDDGQVERVWAVGERFVELPVDAEGFEGRGPPTNGAVSALSLTGRVVDAVCLLMIRCGLAVLGQ